jgi:hypothetical protein
MLFSVVCLGGGVALHSAAALSVGVLAAFVSTVLCLPGSSVLFVAAVLCAAWVTFGHTAYHTITHVRLYSNATLD